MESVLVVDDSKLNPRDEVSNGTRRIESRKRGESVKNHRQIDIPQQNDQVAIQERQNSEVEGLRTILDVFRKEIASMQLETQKLSSNITTAQREFSQLSTQIHNSTPDQLLKSERVATSSNEAPTAATRFSAARSRGRTESIFTSCSTTRTSSIDSTASSPSGLVQKKVFGRPVLEQPSEETGLQENASIKQGWLWKTPITSSERNLKKGWTKRWFVLKGFILSYYRLKESSISPGKDAEGRVPKRNFDLSSGSAMIRKANLDDLAKKMKDIKKFLPKGDVEVDEEANILRCFIFVQVAEGKLCLRAENPDDAASWLSLFSKRLSQITYIEKTRNTSAEPDQRVLKILEHPEMDNWDFNNCANTQSLLVGLTDLLVNCANIKGLSLARCKLSDDDIMKIQGPLATISPRVSLQRLDLSENMIRAKGASGLGLAICEFSTLREILLDHNQLSDRGLEILARNIWGCGRPIGVSLQIFSVVDNNITDKGVQVFAEILAKAPTPIGLKTLHLGQNRISDQGTAILRVCKGHPNIVIDLQSDEICLEILPRYNSSKSRRALFQE